MRNLRAPIVCLIAALALSGLHGAGPRRSSRGTGPRPRFDGLCRGRCRRPGGAYQLGPGDRLRVVDLRPGRPHQYLCDRRRGNDHPAPDRIGAGPRPHAGRACQRDLGPAAQRLHPRAVGGGRDRIVPPVLHPRRGRRSRPISLCAQHDGGERGGDRRRFLDARQAQRRHPHPHRRVGIGPASSCRWARRSVPATPYSSASAGSDRWRSQQHRGQPAPHPACRPCTGRRDLPSLSWTSPTARSNVAIMSASSPTA